MATCTVAQIFTNSILSAVCDDIRVIRATEQVAILSIEMIRVDSWDSWAKKKGLLVKTGAETPQK